MRSVAWFVEPSLRALGDAIAAGQYTRGTPGATVASADAFLSAMNETGAVGFVDQHALPMISNKGGRPNGPVIVVATEGLPQAVAWLGPHPWVCHVVNTKMFEHPLAAEHLQNVIQTSASQKRRLLDWIGPEVSGRRIRLAQASRRVERLERMSEYLSANGVGSRTIEQLRDAAEELLTNAFYDAPVSAGAINHPISRSYDVSLPEKYACDLAYGTRADLAIVRVKDPFGSLSRERLVEVLSRCSRSDMGVQVDESMGGAGLGMWRIFSNATFVSVSVVRHLHTEILVGIAKRAPGPRPFAFHLFFADAGKRHRWSQTKDDSIQPGINQSLLLELTDKGFE